jgi:hypothetical protein
MPVAFRWHQPALALTLLAALAPASRADSGHLPEVQVYGPRDAEIGSADSASEGAAERESYQSRPKLRPGDIVEAVPGVVATQHSGDGKANQYFLRGFNLDHGTDFAVSVDGMPVNMPTHGHGQGFADLNFLIPELVSGVSYRKGPYSVDAGDFSLAGSASLDYFSALEQPFAQVTVGAHNYRRTLLAGSRTVGDQTWLAALELMGNDGPWVNPEGLRKFNAVLRYAQGTPTRGWRLTAMAYDSHWNSTDQVPQRLIDTGLLPRFGAVDPSDGGQTRRLSLSGTWFDTGPAGRTQISAYAIDYSLRLWSDFTYALDNPVNGDQFEQTDRRQVYGAQATQRRPNRLGGLDGVLSLGASWRGDRIGEVGLYQTQDRIPYATVRQDRVSQDLYSAYVQQLLNFNDRWRAYLGLRGDAMNYRVTGQEPVYGPGNSGSGHDALLSPKAGLAWTVSAAHELYVNAGTGFHSNDVRGATITVDPQTGLAADRVPVLVRGRGAELGWRFAPHRDLSMTMALWRLDVDSELVYAGDTGTTEPGRASTRRGLEATLRWKPAPHWRVEVDAALSRARFVGTPPAGEGNYIDNAVEQVLAAGLAWQQGPWSATLRLRHMGARALDTLNSVRSSPTTLLNLGLRYALGNNTSIGVEVFNLADRQGNDIEYYYASCTAREVAGGTCSGGINDRHVHPMEPRTVRLTWRTGF